MQKFFWARYRRQFAVELISTLHGSSRTGKTPGLYITFYLDYGIEKKI